MFLVVSGPEKGGRDASLRRQGLFSIRGIEAVFEFSTFQPEKSLHKKKPNSWGVRLLNEEIFQIRIKMA